MTARLLDVGEIANELNGVIDSLVLELLPNGVLEGGEWRVGSIAGERGRSMAVRLTGAKAGTWCDFGGPPEHRGDALDLVAQVYFRGDKRQAIRWARAWLGLDQVDPASFEKKRAAAVAKKEKQKRDAEDTRRQAQHIFLAAKPDILDTPVERYLRGRGIDFRALGRAPRSLRYEPALWNGESQRKWPAMVAAITDLAGDMVAVHRTWLEIRADGRVTKAPLEDAKMTLGTYAGAAIRLWRGASGRPLRDAPAGEWVAIGEGIEDTATAIMAAPQQRALVAVSGANLGSLHLPPQLAGVIILAQNDEEPQAKAALERAIAHFQDAGKRVRLARPPVGVKDINELAQRAL